MNMYNLLCRKYVMTNSKRLIFTKHRYDKKAYIINLLKKNKIILEDNESYKSISDEILKSNTECYTKYVNDFCCNRLLNKKREVAMCFHPPIVNWVSNDSYCPNHQDKKI